MKKDSLILFTGVVINAYDLEPIPQVNIQNLSRRMGTSSDNKGTFSFLARKNDTVLFSAMGFKVYLHIIPDTLTKQKYSLYQTLSRDTLDLPETLIYPFPPYDKLKEKIIGMKSKEEEMKEIADKNMSPVKRMILSQDYKSDAGMNFQYFVQNQMDTYYSNGQIAPQKIFDIFSWAKFIKALKNGDFKRKDK